MGTDLVRHKDRWASGVKWMRDLFSRLEAEGYSRDAQTVWRQHWDFQLWVATVLPLRHSLLPLCISRCACACWVCAAWLQSWVKLCMRHGQ